MMLLGAKESFLTRVLTGKVKDANIDCEFIPFSVDSINEKWEGTQLVTLFMDSGERPKSDVLHFLSDKMNEDGIRMIVIGEKEDVDHVLGKVPKDVVYRSFVRPVNNEDYVKCVVELYSKFEAGEFRKQILIVDDDVNYLGLIREWLKSDYKVNMANSGLQAIKWLGKNKADLILLDHEMPVTSGPQVLEMLRSDNETKDIPVMFLTGKSDKASVMQVLSLKPEGYFLKNIGREELLEKLEEFFILHG